MRNIHLSFCLWHLYTSLITQRQYRQLNVKGGKFSHLYVDTIGISLWSMHHQWQLYIWWSKLIILYPYGWAVLVLHTAALVQFSEALTLFSVLDPAPITAPSVTLFFFFLKNPKKRVRPYVVSWVLLRLLQTWGRLSVTYLCKILQNWIIGA